MGKKIIAICQSGGDFETDKDGSLSYNGGEAYAVDLDEDAKIAEFKQDLAETYKCCVDGLLIKYFLPGNKKTLITVSQDKDLKRMINFYAASEVVDVFVMSNEDGAVAVVNTPKMPTRKERDVAVVNTPKMPARKESAVAVVNTPKMPTRRSSRETVSEAAVIAAPTPVSTSHPITYPDIVIANEPDPDPDPDPDPLDIVINEPPAMVQGDSNSNGKHLKAATLWANTITGVGQRFFSINEFREALHKYSIAHGFTYKYKKNDAVRVSVKCASEGCPWYIHASRLSTTQLVCIKKMTMNHTCEGDAVEDNHRGHSRLMRKTVGGLIKDKLKDSPNYKPKDIIDDIKREYGIELQYRQAWRAREKALTQLQGSYTEAYSQLPFFCEKIIETNPGSLATFNTKEDSSFHRLFVSFHASISGFQQGCRPLLFLDSFPLNSKYRGMLLAATAADGDDGFFPLSFAVVDEETDENWHWFLLELKSAVSASQKITFIAHPQKVLRESLVDVFGGDCYHGYCLHYLAEKLNNDMKGQLSREARQLLVQDFYAAAYTPKVESFQVCADNIKAISPVAYKWVISSEPEHWANAFFQGARYNHMTSDFGQDFYTWVSDANELPITHMVDVLRGKMMELMYTRRVESNQWVTTLTPSMEEKLKSEDLKANSFQVLLSQGNTFEVQSESGVDIVNPDHWDCTCKGWQLHGLPCCHAIAVFKWIGRDPYDYCSTYFTAESFRKTYAESIYPVPNTDMPLDELNELANTVTPPPTKRGAGRPKRKHPGPGASFKRKSQCSKCKEMGHNRKTCTERNAEGSDIPCITGVVASEEEEM